MGNQAKRLMRRGVVWLVVAVLIVWPAYRILHSLGSGDKRYDSTKLLYQVAQFQMELLSSALSESGKIKETEELNELRLIVYSANYTHERLVLAMGESKLTALRSLPELLQLLLRYQIGGERPLKPDETDTLNRAAGLFKPIFESYGKLLTSGGEVVGSADDKLHKADEELYAMLHKKLLP
ncbi:S-adenosylmethionine decarboxylase [Paenibacillus sp. HJGM_3]|uniref:S-adenosylmethionine decarboxylase n=1 Tax=Paenibacillus sp. HJGM_3 TaxID=3379816 RepID=UPI00385D79C8